MGSEGATFRVAPGDVLGEKFQVERVLGQGGMGLVVAAMHLQLRERVALKFLLPEAAERSDYRARFLREAQATAKLHSEHVARVIDVGTLEGDLPYMVMEYLEGEDLQAILRAKKRLSVREAIDLILQAMEGVAEAHAHGIVHRDLKPSNLFVSLTRGGERVVKVLDFGISKILTAGEEPSDLTQTSSALGSPMYMSPEQVRSAKTVDTRTDVWSLGVILFEMLTGQTPWKNAESATAVCAMIAADEPPTMRSLRPELPPELDALVQRALAKPVDDRLQNVASFAAQLAEIEPTSTNQDSFERITRTLTGSRRRTRVREPSPAHVVILSPGGDATLARNGPDSFPAPTSAPLRPARAAPWSVVVSATGALFLLIAVVYRLTNGSHAAELPLPAAAPPASSAQSVPAPAASVAAPPLVATAPSAVVAAPSAPPAAPSVSPVRVKVRPPQAAPNPFADRE